MSELGASCRTDGAPGGGSQLTAAGRSHRHFRHAEARLRGDVVIAQQHRCGNNQLANPMLFLFGWFFIFIWAHESNLQRRESIDPKA